MRRADSMDPFADLAYPNATFLRNLYHHSQTPTPQKNGGLNGHL